MDLMIRRQGLTNPRVDTIGLLLQNQLVEFSDPVTTRTPWAYLFQGKTALKRVSLPNATGAIGTSCFDGCTSLEEVNIYHPTDTYAYSFRNCSSLKEIDLSTITGMIDNYAFYGCTSLESIDIGSATTIGQYAFYHCWELSDSDFSSATTISAHAFRECGANNCTFNPITINDSSFRDIRYLNVSYFPRLTTINGTYAFGGSYKPAYSSTTSLVLPVLTTIASTYSLSYNYLLSSIDIGNLTNIPTNTFHSNSALQTLILRSNTVTTLANVGAFTSTPFASDGTGGVLYVPENLIESYQAAANWSTILGYPNNQIVAIEGSQYENYYADGTPVPEPEEAEE